MNSSDTYDAPAAWVREHLNDPVAPLEPYQDCLLALFQDRPVVLCMPRPHRFIRWPS
jgi:hypothetical protein